MDILHVWLKVASACAEELRKGVTKMKNRLIEGVEVQRSFRNMFSDLHMPDADKLKIKTGLVI